MLCSFPAKGRGWSCEESWQQYGAKVEGDSAFFYLCFFVWDQSVVWTKFDSDGMTYCFFFSYHYQMIANRLYIHKKLRWALFEGPLALVLICLS